MFRFVTQLNQWRRVLIDGFGNYKVEIALTSASADDWQSLRKQIIYVTPCDWTADRAVAELPAEVQASMVVHLGLDFTAHVLTYDYLANIDWMKFDSGRVNEFEQIAVSRRAVRQYPATKSLTMALAQLVHEALSLRNASFDPDAALKYVKGLATIQKDGAFKRILNYEQFYTVTASAAAEMVCTKVDEKLAAMVNLVLLNVDEATKWCEEILSRKVEVSKGYSRYRRELNLMFGYPADSDWHAAIIDGYEEEETETENA